MANPGIECSRGEVRYFHRILALYSVGTITIDVGKRWDGCHLLNRKTAGFGARIFCLRNLTGNIPIRCSEKNVWNI